MPTYSSPPPWFRLVVIGASVLLLCSCQAALPTPVIRGQSPDVPLAEPTACPAGCRVCGSAGCARQAGDADDEWLCDGGDYHLPVAVRRDGLLLGLDQEDAVAHYQTVDGQTIVAPSNQVCIYAPRFGAVRQVIDLHEYHQSAMLVGAVQQHSAERINEREHPAARMSQTEPILHRRNAPPSLLNRRQQAGELERRRRAAVVLSSLAPYANLQVVRTGQAEWTERVDVARASLAALTWTANQGPQVVLGIYRAKAEVSLQQPGVIYQTEEPDLSRLRLVKLASTDHAQPGEEVEFTFRFDNIGALPIGNVTLVDSLTTRLEYVAASQQSTLPAEFTTQPNEAGSLVLQWDLAEPLAPGEGGVIRFRCRVR